MENKKKEDGLALGESVSNSPKNGVRAWIIAILVILAAIAVVMSSKKLNPAMEAMLAFFGQDTTYGGTLGSVYSFVAVCLLIPMGALIAKFSTKWLAVASLGILAVGTFLGAATESSEMFLVFRIIEGIGYTGIYAIGGVFITRWFDEEHRGVPMGIYTCNVGLAQVIVLNTSTFIIPAYGWQGLWIFIGIITLIVIAGFIFIVKDWPRGGEVEALKEAEEREKKNQEKAKITDTFKAPVLWVLCGMFFCFGLGMQGTMMFSNMILTQTAGVDAATANLMSTVMSVGQMITPIVGGFIISKVCVNHKDKRGLVTSAFFLLAFIAEFCFFALSVNPTLAWVTSVLMGCTSFFAPALYMIASDHAPSPALVGLSFTIFLFGQFVAGIIGPYIIGWFNTTFGSFMAAKWLILALGIVGTFLAVYLTTADRKFVLAQQAKAAEEAGE